MRDVKIILERFKVLERFKEDQNKSTSVLLFQKYFSAKHQRVTTSSDLAKDIG